MTGLPISTGADKLGQIAELLSRMIGHGQAHLAPPTSIARIEPGEIDALAAKLMMAEEQLIEGGNPLATGGVEARLLLDALMCRLRERSATRVAKWDLIITGAVMLVRDQLGNVLEQRKNLQGTQ